MLSLSFIKEIEKIIGRENVLTGEADRQNYAYDAALSSVPHARTSLGR